MNAALPAPADVGVFYDRFTRLFEILWGDSLHFGYWPNGATGGSIEDGQERLTDLMIANTEIRSGAAFLDVGCGTGRASLRLVEHTGCRLTGINVSHEQVRAAVQRAASQARGDAAQFSVTDAMQTRFDPATFDAAWAFESLLHMPDLGGALREIHRVLKPGACLTIADVVAVTPMSREDDAYYRQVFPVAPLVSRATYLETLRGAGFEVAKALDISREVERTLTLTLDNVDARAAEIREAYGEEAAGAVKSSWSKGIEIHLRSLGYFVFVARKR